MSTQTENLARVSTAIRHHVVAFFSARQHGDEYHLRDLEKYVEEKSGGSPESPGRVMRDERRAKRIDYEVVDRSKSLYRVVWQAERQQELF